MINRNKFNYLAWDYTRRIIKWRKKLESPPYQPGDRVVSLFWGKEVNPGDIVTIKEVIPAESAMSGWMCAIDGIPFHLDSNFFIPIKDHTSSNEPASSKK